MQERSCRESQGKLLRSYASQVSALFLTSYNVALTESDPRLFRRPFENPHRPSSSLRPRPPLPRDLSRSLLHLPATRADRRRHCSRDRFHPNLRLVRPLAADQDGTSRDFSNGGRLLVPGTERIHQGIFQRLRGRPQERGERSSRRVHDLGGNFGRGRELLGVEVCYFWTCWRSGRMRQDVMGRRAKDSCYR